MDITTILFFFGIAVIIAMIVFVIRRVKSFESTGSQHELQILLQQMDKKVDGMQTRIDASQEAVHQTIQTQFGQSAQIIRDVTERLTKLDETNRQVMSFTEQLNRLQDTLNNPKRRGAFGEFTLETMLGNVLSPKDYTMQYAFKNGEAVDAVIFVGDKIIPIDAKFSLENYNRLLDETNPQERERLEKLFKQDTKNRIDETAKYIRPEEKTMDFAFMFIPAEAIYYDLLVNQIGAVKVSTRDLIEYAFKEKHVIIVSPTSFVAYLQTVLQGLRAMRIEESAKEIQKNVELLARHLDTYEHHMERLGNQIDTTKRTYDTASKEFQKIDKDVTKIAGPERGARPKLDEGAPDT